MLTFSLAMMTSSNVNMSTFSPVRLPTPKPIPRAVRSISPGSLTPLVGFSTPSSTNARTSNCSLDSIANDDILKREYYELLARADPSAPPDESGALNIPGIINTFGGFFDAFFNKREELELFARSLAANEAMLKREYADILARADPSAPVDESGALNIPGLINTFSGLFNAFFNKREDFESLSRSLASDDLFMREYSELLARADPSASVDESGAINFGKIVDTVGGLINAFFNKREEFELLARGLAADDGVLKREFVELLSRADSSAPSDESGAINFGKIIDTVGGLIGAFFNKREELDMMAREFEARSLNELD
ncbi:hypothetical protein QCA50_007593 [Cerrena zonata]|uniref:Uncharacterized protein n=1 Tax=Cerrena zonata TaxID=2478898 RepID=A0AAW0GG18_9APHY